MNSTSRPQAPGLGGAPVSALPLANSLLEAPGPFKTFYSLPSDMMNLLASLVLASFAVAHQDPPSDCELTGESTSAYSFGDPVSTTTTGDEYLFTCPDGTVIRRQITLRVTTREVTVTTTRTQVSPSGAGPCPDVVSVSGFTEVLSEHTVESGEVCVDPDECCVIVNHTWSYEFGDPDPPVETKTTRRIECPDGSPGTETTTVTTHSGRRRKKFVQNREARGDCDPEETCDPVTFFGPWTYFTTGGARTVTTDCDRSTHSVTPLGTYPRSSVAARTEPSPWKARKGTLSDSLRLTQPVEIRDPSWTRELQQRHAF